MRQEEAMYLGIDVSKGYADFFLMDSNKNAIERGFQLDDNHQGHEELLKYLQRRTMNGARIICGVESTGGYEQNWLTAIKRQVGRMQVEVYKLNPKGVKHQIESTMKRTITDSVSAEGIAQYLVNNYQKKQSDWQHSTFQQEQLVSAQRCFHFIQGLIKQQTARYNQMEKLLYQMFPELLVFCKQGIPHWMIRLLTKYPGRSSIHRAHVASIDKIKGISLAKAEQLKTLAKTSVAGSSSSMAEKMLQTLAEDIQHHHARIEDLKKYLAEHHISEDLEIVKSIRGIGDWTATALIMLLGPLDRFDGTDKLAAFFGVNPKFKQSGDGKWGVRMSKQGSSDMRAVLFVAANNVILHEPYFKQRYAHYLSNGMKAKAAKGVIMHKLLRILYGMLKNHSRFDQRIDEQNQQRTPANPSKPIKNTTRRFQKLSTNAPISRSNTKKRRAVLECQPSESDSITASSKTTHLQK
jgi:transposase